MNSILLQNNRYELMVNNKLKYGFYHFSVITE
jgi:hypothetical protein